MEITDSMDATATLNVSECESASHIVLDVSADSGDAAGIYLNRDAALSLAAWLVETARTL